MRYGPFTNITGAHVRYVYSLNRPWYAVALPWPPLSHSVYVFLNINITVITTTSFCHIWSLWFIRPEFIRLIWEWLRHHVEFLPGCTWARVFRLLLKLNSVKGANTWQTNQKLLVEPGRFGKWGEVPRRVGWSNVSQRYPSISVPQYSNPKRNHPKVNFNSSAMLVSIFRFPVVFSAINFSEGSLILQGGEICNNLKANFSLRSGFKIPSCEFLSPNWKEKEDKEDKRKGRRRRNDRKSAK